MAKEVQQQQKEFVKLQEAAVVRRGAECLVVLRKSVNGKPVEEVLKITEDRRIAADRVMSLILEVKL